MRRYRPFLLLGLAAVIAFSTSSLVYRSLVNAQSHDSTILEKTQDDFYQERQEQAAAERRETLRQYGQALVDRGVAVRHSSGACFLYVEGFEASANLLASMPCPEEKK